MQTPYTTSKSTLMHACLVHLSPQIRTMDCIIRGSSNMSALPTEILLLIREQLFPLINTHLVQQSTAALEAYEHSLRNLLCPDCIVYNLDIYGPDVWQWDQFRGPCSCLDTSSGPGPSPSPIKTSPLDPKPFRDAQHWLEAHLSKEAAALGTRSRAAAAETAASNNGSAIWDVVAFVLREYDCEFIRESEDEPTTARFHTTLTLSRYHSLQIVPFPALESSATTSAILGRVARELCLEGAEPFGAHQRDPSSFKRLLSGSNPPILQHQDHLQVLFGIIGSLLAGCVSFPITCTTIAVSIFCFYSRPKSLRLF